LAIPLLAACPKPAASSDTAGPKKGSPKVLKPGEKRELTVKEIVELRKPGVVRVQTDRGVGTGFVVSPDGRIATNLHVIAGASEITIELADKRKFVVAKVLAANPETDLVVLQIDATGLEVMPLGDSDKAAAGDPIVIIGNPLGVLDFTVSDGLVSSVRDTGALKLIQTSAPISQGSSGGPLFNNFGEVIGVATFFSAEGQNLNFAIPSNYLIPLVAADGGETFVELRDRFRTTSPIPVAARPTVPIHETTAFKDCTDEQMASVAAGISKAIEVGAPVYNRGEHEACFVIYRSAAEGFVKDSAMCGGVKEAFSVGLKRSETESDFTKKAWAMRDAFDGLLIVIGKKSAGQ